MTFLLINTKSYSVKKAKTLIGDFNVDLLKYEDDTNTADFLNKINSTSLIPQITFPTKKHPDGKHYLKIFFQQMLMQKLFQVT